MFLNGLLSKRERELIERNTYLNSEYNKDYKNDWYYGSDLVDEIVVEGKLLGSGYSLEDFSEEY